MGCDSYLDVYLDVYLNIAMNMPIDSGAQIAASKKNGRKPWDNTAGPRSA